LGEFVRNGYSSNFGGRLIHDVELTQEQQELIDAGMAEIKAGLTR